MTTVDITACDYSNPGHLQAIVSLINAYIEDRMGGGTPLSKQEQLRLIDGLHSHPKSIVLLADAGDGFAGLLIAFENFSTFSARPMINIHDLIVPEEYRGQGIGRQLMNAVINEARKRNCSRVTLEVRKDNIKAQNLYRSLGFEATEPEMFYRRRNL